jgi:alkanesulfonate monooxygenase
MPGRLQVGVSARNFTPHPVVPDAAGLLEYAERAETLGFDSVWVWDHLLLGSARPFPVLDSLAMLAAMAARTTRVQLGTGVLVLPLRNPVELAKVTSTIDHLSGGRLVLGLAGGWYAKEFAAAGVPFDQRGRLVEQGVEVLQQFWTEYEVNGEAGDKVFKRAVMLPKPVQRPAPTLLMGGYVDRVLKRVATMSDGWLTYFYRPDDFVESWTKVQGYAEAAGKDPATLKNASQLPICVADSYEEADEQIREFVAGNFDEPVWSKATVDSAIRGTPEQCVEQLAEHVGAGVQHLILVPWEYAPEQLDALASDVVPALRLAVSDPGDAP